MGRRLRPHLPGASFHITARTQGRAELFTPELRTAIADDIRDYGGRSDAELLAYAVMKNHLHLVVRQGDEPLWRLMQPLLRKAAARVRRRHGHEDHVFGDSFDDVVCQDPEHLRNAIVYTHLNPVRARLCEKPSDYEWTSHGDYAGTRPEDPGLAAASGLRLFGSSPGQSRAALCTAYGAFVQWRVDADRHDAALAAGLPIGTPPLRPSTQAGDLHWGAALRSRPAEPQPASPPSAANVAQRKRPPDLRDVALAVLQEVDPQAALELVRSRYGGPHYVQLRHGIIERAHAVGYRGRQIARYLRISDNAVSRVLAAHRKSALLR